MHSVKNKNSKKYRQQTVSLAIPLISLILLSWGTSLSAYSQSSLSSSYRHRMKAIPDENKFFVARNLHKSTDSPNPKGWYHSVAGVVETNEGLVATYRLSDAHTCLVSHIMVAYSQDGGRTWKGHRSISEKNAYEDGAVWIAPQLSKLSDGRLVVIVDLGERDPSDDWPMLSKWQQPSRGMSNHLFWSDDNGQTWDGPHKIDDVGGEPGYIVELSDGTLMYTRTESAQTDQLWNPPLPWGDTYYRSVAVFSDDNGQTWDRTSILADSPLHGDCEVGVVELAPDTLLAVTRIGFGGGRFGQPSRLIYSYDNGRRWTRHQMAPFYGQRTIVRKLQSGKLLVTYRHRWGTLASYAVMIDPSEAYGFQPSSFIWEPENCRVENEVMTISSEKGTEGQVEFSLYPAQAPSTDVTIETELKVEAADKNGCVINAGIGIRFAPNRVSLVEKPEIGFDIDASQWHTYKIVRTQGKVFISVDGKQQLEENTADMAIRYVSFGTDGNQENSSLTYWRSLSARVENQNDYSIDWQWHARDGYPDQFRRDREVLLDKSADSGYSGWWQTENGDIVIVDYTNESIHNASQPQAPQPFIRSYLTNEAFVGQ